jgi:ubiquinone/menaquinone biosynthesis C-methylase UbiE
LNAPLQVPDDVDVTYVDRAPVQVLRSQYSELRDQPLVPVSVIGDAHDLSAFADGSVDFVIANHLLEHLEDPIRGLQEMVRVIRKGGVLYTALPDPRVTFDVDRDLTSVDHVVDEYRHGTSQTREGHYQEWVAKAEQHVAWMQEAGVRSGSARVRELMEMDYSIHFHVWRPDTFLGFIAAATSEANLELEIVDFQPRQEDDDEFIFVFLKGSASAQMHVPPLPEEREIDHLRARLSGLDSQVAALSAQSVATDRQLAALTRSRSWRITGPLRATSRAAGQLRERALGKRRPCTGR